jgi:3-oxoacyl-[acyl-carrier protein] reductase
MKNAIVLGASGSLGKELVSQLLKEEYYVIGTYHAQPPKDELFSNPSVQMIRLEMGNRDSIDKFCATLEKFERIDFLTNTIANTLTVNRFERTDIGDFENDFLVNVLNYIYLIQKISDKFNAGTHIVFVLTEMVLNEPPNYFSSYVSSKYALLGLMKCMANEFAMRRIRVNAVSPGMMDTKFTWQMKINQKISPMPSSVKEKYLHTTRAKKLIAPYDVAQTIMGIVHDEKIQGQNIPVLGERD